MVTLDTCARYLCETTVEMNTWRIKYPKGRMLRGDREALRGLQPGAGECSAADALAQNCAGFIESSANCCHRGAHARQASKADCNCNAAEQQADDAEQRGASQRHDLVAVGVVPDGRCVMR